MNIKNILIILTFIKIINCCISLEIANYDIFLLKTSNINNENITFRLLIDTGSYYTWVSGVDINNHLHHYYKITSKDKKNLISKNITRSFNSGDKINFSLYKFNLKLSKNININNMPIGITNYETISNTIYDGFIGLGGFYGNRTFVKSIKNNIITKFMVKQKIIKNNIFSLYINDTNTEYGLLNINGGKIMFGEIDQKYKNNIKWYKIYIKDDIYYFWNLFLNEIVINGKKTKINDKVSIDSGTSDIVFNKYICDELHKQINGKYNDQYKRYIINEYNDLKEINFNLNGDNYTLKPNDYSYLLNGTIYSRIIFNENGNKVLGLPFLQKYYSIYDFDNEKIGLSEKVEN